MQHSPSRGVSTVLPAVIAAFLGGIVVDRFGRKRMSIVSDLASGITVAFIPLLYITVGLQFWQLLILVFLSALLDAPGNAARKALLPDLAYTAPDATFGWLVRFPGLAGWTGFVLYAGFVTLCAEGLFFRGWLLQ